MAGLQRGMSYFAWGCFFADLLPAPVFPTLGCHPMRTLATNHALDVPRASQGGVVAAMHLLWATAPAKQPNMQLYGAASRSGSFVRA